MPTPALRPLAERLGLGWFTAVLVILPQLAPLEVMATPPPASAKRATVTPLQQVRVTYDTYLLGPGDSLQIELENVPELSGTFTIGPDGTLYLPRLRALYVDGLTIEELRYFLMQQFKPFIKNPEIYIRPIAYRPVRVYVGGEVNRPGYYTLSEAQQIQALSESSNNQLYLPSSVSPEGGGNEINRSISYNTSANREAAKFNPYVVPTVYDAIRASEGVTPYSNLSNILITRKQPLSSGGGKARASVNLLSMITHGDESQNARLFDGDILYVTKSPIVLLDQLLTSGRTNLNPQFLNVFISGRVKLPGNTILPQGSTLNQALISSGVQLLHGKVEFVRINRDGKLDRRLFSFDPNQPIDSTSNPVLMSGDIIRVQDSGLSAATSLLNELTGPFVGVYSVYSLFRGAR